jgi:hypothetical protein
MEEGKVSISRMTWKFSSNLPSGNVFYHCVKLASRNLFSMPSFHWIVPQWVWLLIQLIYRKIYPHGKFGKKKLFIITSRDQLNSSHTFFVNKLILMSSKTHCISRFDKNAHVKIYNENNQKKSSLMDSKNKLCDAMSTITWLSLPASPNSKSHQSRKLFFYFFSIKSND